MASFLQPGDILERLISPALGGGDRAVCPGCGTEAAAALLTGTVGCAGCFAAFQNGVGRWLGRRGALPGSTAASGTATLFDAREAASAAPAAWVVASRVELTRNRADLPFPGLQRKADAIAALAAADRVLATWKRTAGIALEARDASAGAAPTGPARAWVSLDAGLVVRVNDLHHFRFAAAGAGLAWADGAAGLAALRSLAVQFGREFALAADSSLGWLGPDLAGLGPAVSAGAILHLPALELAGGGLPTLPYGAALEPLAGTDGFRRLVCRGRPGQSEAALLADATRALAILGAAEAASARARRATDPVAFDDRGARAWAVLGACRRLSPAEFAALVAECRMAADGGASLPGIDRPRLDRLARLALRLQAPAALDSLGVPAGADPAAAPADPAALAALVRGIVAG